MAPTLLPGDRISAVTRSSSLHTGDVVVFHPTNTSQGYPPGPEIKRIIGLPGERIASSGDTVLINGKPLAEPYLPLGQPFGAPIVTAVVPAGHYFVMGDNRADTEDSRYFGAIPSSSIIGVATAIVGPPSRAGPISGSSR
jgi:signal peptidase I